MKEIREAILCQVAKAAEVENLSPIEYFKLSMLVAGDLVLMSVARGVKVERREEIINQAIDSLRKDLVDGIKAFKDM